MTSETSRLSTRARQLLEAAEKAERHLVEANTGEVDPRKVRKALTAFQQATGSLYVCLQIEHSLASAQGSTH